MQIILKKSDKFDELMAAGTENGTSEGYEQ
jgi:hypothetical protein